MTKNLEKLKAKIKRTSGRIQFTEEKFFKDLTDMIKFAITIEKGIYTVPDSIKILGGKEIKQQIGASRSIEDLTLLAKTYFPDATFDDVYEALNKLSLKGQINTWLCYTFRKRMYRLQTGFKQDLTIMSSHSDFNYINE